MNLEDHLGDILRKARLMKGLSPAAVASAGGLTEPELAALENTGSGLAHQNLATLASLLELNPGKLDSIARGWVPSVKDLGAWRELRQISTTEAGNTVHCYLIWDEVTRDAALFDTGWNAGPVLQEVEASQLQLKHLFLTHTHVDHVGGMQAIRERFPKIFLHTDAKSAPPQHRNRRNDCVQLGSLRLSNPA